MRNGIAFYHMHEGMNTELMRSLVLILYTNMVLKDVHLDIKYFLTLANIILSMLYCLKYLCAYKFVVY